MVPQQPQGMLKKSILKVSGGVGRGKQQLKELDSPLLAFMALRNVGPISSSTPKTSSTPKIPSSTPKTVVRNPPSEKSLLGENSSAASPTARKEGHFYRKSLVDSSDDSSGPLDKEYGHTKQETTGSNHR